MRFGGQGMWTTTTWGTKTEQVTNIIIDTKIISCYTIYLAKLKKIWSSRCLWFVSIQTRQSSMKKWTNAYCLPLRICLNLLLGHPCFDLSSFEERLSIGGTVMHILGRFSSISRELSHVCLSFREIIQYLPGRLSWVSQPPPSVFISKVPLELVLTAEGLCLHLLFKL